jgi:translation initiation factor IF-2
MSKTRVYEYAKKYNISSKDVITKLKEMNIEVSNHMATIEEADIVKLDAIYNKKEGKEPQKQTNPEQHGQKNGNQKQTSQPNKQQIQPKTSAKAYEEDADKAAVPTKVKVATPPKAKEGKKHDQDYQ